MHVQPLQIPEVRLIRPQIHGDERGFFLEVWNQERYRAAGLERPFVQLNHSRSAGGTLRGLHFQWRQPQGKLVRLIAGEVFDVAVDLRPGSPTFGRWTGHLLSAAGQEQLWIPERFAHGFCVLSGSADFEYLCTEPYRADDDAVLAWNDPEIGVDWPLEHPLLSDKDRDAPPLAEIRERLAREWGG
jgi:dTDP-4-dehydrorhamnose 3,5-epimerase